jgi:hypothetical protein
MRTGKMQTGRIRDEAPKRCFSEYGDSGQRFQKHVRVTYHEREWLLSEKKVADVLTVLIATKEIPEKIIAI